MLKKRIIPVLLTDGIQCVKPVQFKRPYRKLGPIEQYINVMELRDVDELVIIDIEATPQGREPNYDRFSRLTSNLYCPVTYGGGVASLDHIQKILAAGADKVLIHSKANPHESGMSFIKTAAEKFGSQAIVIAVDAIAKDIFKFHDIYYVNAYVKEQNVVYADISDLINAYVMYGAGEILLTSVDKDGTLSGYDLELLEASKDSKIPVIINGGCGGMDDVFNAFNLGADAVGLGSLFLYTDHTPRSVATIAQSRGIPVRA